MDIELDGFDETIDTLEDMEKKAKELDGKNEVPIGEPFTDEFMQTYTEFDSLDVFFEESPWEVESDEDIEAIPQDGMDEYVDEHTEFSELDEMTGKAGGKWAAKKLGFS